MTADQRASTLVVETSIHLWRSGAPCLGFDTHSDYGGLREFTRKQLCRINAMNNISRITPHKRRYTASTERSEKKIMSKLKEETMEQMGDLVFMVCMGAKLLFGNCTGSLLTSNFFRNCVSTQGSSAAIRTPLLFLTKRLCPLGKYTKCRFVSVVGLSW